MAENERPCGQPSVSTCVLLCLLASVPLYLFTCVPLYLCACALASASTWSTVRTCVLLFLFTCDTWSTKCEHLCTCALVCLCASVLVCFVLASASTWSTKCDHFCTCLPACFCTCVLAYLQLLVFLFTYEYLVIQVLIPGTIFGATFLKYVRLAKSMFHN